MIYLLSEEIQSGKTTSIQLCTENRYDIGGFLSPDQNGSRYLLNLQNKKEIPFEIDLTNFDGPYDIIGKYAISRESFSIAHEWIKDHLANAQSKHIVIDEVGPLELQGKGFADSLRYAKENIGTKNLIIVVRESLLDKVIQAFELYDAERLTKNGIQQLLS